MIGRLTGTAIEVDFEKRQLLLEVGGVGYELCIPQELCEAVTLGGEQRLYVHTDIKEDSQTLFGFASKSQRELFRLLLGVGGVGAKSAAAMLSEFSEAEVVRCVVEEDVKGLSKVRGIGPKTAGVIVVSLKDKVSSLAAAVTDLVLPRVAVIRDAIEVLVRLGLREADATALARQAWSENMELEELITEALRISALKR